MATERNAILTSGLGAFATGDPNAQAVFGPNAGAKAQELLQTSIDKANAAGFDLVRCDANTQDPEDTLKRFSETLQSRKFAGVNIGYGLRGHKGKISAVMDGVCADIVCCEEHTALFEKMLNMALEMQPGIKIMFSNGPADVINGIQRNFPESFKDLQ